MLQIKLIYNTTILLKLTPNLNNENALLARPWRNGSHIGTPTSRRCFTTMDERGWW